MNNYETIIYRYEINLEARRSIKRYKETLIKIS